MALGFFSSYPGEIDFTGNFGILIFQNHIQDGCSVRHPSIFPRPSLTPASLLGDTARIREFSPVNPTAPSTIVIIKASQLDPLTEESTRKNTELQIYNQ
jgi:hypothetical protein